MLRFGKLRMRACLVSNSCYRDLSYRHALLTEDEALRVLRPHLEHMHAHARIVAGDQARNLPPAVGSAHGQGPSASKAHVQSEVAVGVMSPIVGANK